MFYLFLAETQRGAGAHSFWHFVHIGALPQTPEYFNQEEGFGQYSICAVQAGTPMTAQGEGVLQICRASFFLLLGLNIPAGGVAERVNAAQNLSSQLANRPFRRICHSRIRIITKTYSNLAQLKPVRISNGIEYVSYKTVPPDPFNR